MPLQLTIACGDYDRTHPLIDGTVKPEGIDLNWLVLPHLEIWTRMLNYYDFDASEISLSSYITAKCMGKPLTAIPVFPARAFRHSYIFINTKSGIREPNSLGGVHAIGPVGRYRNSAALLERPSRPDHSQGKKGIQFTGDYRRDKALRMERHISAGVTLQQTTAGPNSVQVGG